MLAHELRRYTGGPQRAHIRSSAAVYVATGVQAALKVPAEEGFPAYLQQRGVDFSGVPAGLERRIVFTRTAEMMNWPATILYALQRLDAKWLFSLKSVCTYVRTPWLVVVLVLTLLLVRSVAKARVLRTRLLVESRKSGDLRLQHNTRSTVG